MPKNPPPDAFMAKMRRLLGAEFASFAGSYAQPAQVGLRVNTLKIRPVDFSSISPFALEPVGPFEPAGFRIAEEERPGSHPYHAAGLYYLQEPSAMAVAALLDPQPGERVLDLAAAPGGKTTHLIARMQDRGLLVANDVDRTRVRYLAENLERWGARSVLITNNTPEQLADQFGAAFDRVLVDAPCSGEGMFRKQGGFEWSEAMVLACARRQTAILDTAARLVRPGGLLAYATCTFSPEEDEGVVGRFLAAHPAFALALPPAGAFLAGAAPGQPSWLPADVQLADTAVLQRARRFWPHRFAGEGHFVALLQRQDAGGAPPWRAASPDPPARADRALWRDFTRATLRAEDWDGARLALVNGRWLHALPDDAPDTGALRVIRHGLPLGELRRGAGGDYVRPSHALALHLRAGDVRQAAALRADDSAVAAFLQGHVLPHAGPDGWVLVAVDGFGLGWGKRVSGQLKNHYPHGLRR